MVTLISESFVIPSFSIVSLFGDIILLFKKFAMEVATKYQMPQYLTLTPEAEEVMKRYTWPGNIRQLKNLTEQLSILMRETRIVTPEILSEYEIWPTVEEQGGLVRVGHVSSDQHSYASEREMLFQMMSAMHSEIKNLKQQVAAMQQNTSVDMSFSPSAAPAVTNHTSSDLPSDPTPYAEEYVEESLSIDEQEKRLIIKALEKNHGRRKKAAEELHISERTLYRKIKEYGLDEN